MGDINSLPTLPLTDMPHPNSAKLNIFATRVGVMNLDRGNQEMYCARHVNTLVQTSSVCLSSGTVCGTNSWEASAWTRCCGD